MFGDLDEILYEPLIFLESRGLAMEDTASRHPNMVVGPRSGNTE